jgi:hypothetical protein
MKAEERKDKYLRKSTIHTTQKVCIKSSEETKKNNL